MSEDKREPGQRREVDWLEYKGNTVPAIIRFAWVVLIVFSAVYLGRYMWPDLQQWLFKSP